MQPRLDRTAFHAGTHEETEQYHNRCQPETHVGRLQVAAYLNSVAFNYDLNKPPRMDRTAFAGRRHAEQNG